MSDCIGSRPDSVFSEVITRQLGAARLDTIFPGYEGKREEWSGVL